MQCTGTTADRSGPHYCAIAILDSKLEAEWSGQLVPDSSDVQKYNTSCFVPRPAFRWQHVYWSVISWTYPVRQ